VSSIYILKELPAIFANRIVIFIARHGRK